MLKLSLGVLAALTAPLAAAQRVVDTGGFELQPGLQEEAPSQAASIWDGVFTDAQAQRGRAVYPGPCGMCHGSRLNGAPDDPDMLSTPPLAGAKFLRNWEGRSLAALLQYTRTTMPANNPGFLSEQEFVDVIAYMLMVGGLPAGDNELNADLPSLARIVIGQSP